MECQICFEIYDSKSIIPKILTNCGHSFCKICLDRIINKKTLVYCPVCREKTNINNKDNLPTNYSLIKIIEKNNEDLPTKNLLEKYKYFDSKEYKYINADIVRNSDPRKLTLKRIVNNDFIYVEEFENNQNISVFTRYAKRNRRYCFNSSSMFANFFNEYSFSIAIFRKGSKCKHQYSCFESILKNIFINAGIAIIAIYPLQYLFEKISGEALDKVNETKLDYLRLGYFGLSSFYKLCKCLVAFYIDELTSLNA